MHLKLFLCMINLIALLFLLIGLFGSDNKVRASFYLFLYTFNLKCKRAKHRGSPKALVTKVIREILLPAWLMPQGMVTSLVFILPFLPLPPFFFVLPQNIVDILGQYKKKGLQAKGVKQKKRRKATLSSRYVGNRGSKSSLF